MFPRLVGLRLAIGCMVVSGAASMAHDEKRGPVAAQTSGPVANVVAKKQTDLEKLVGRWLAVSAEFKGAKLTDAKLKAIMSELVFTPESVVMRRATGTPTKKKFILGPHRVPKEMDVEKAPWGSAIYEVEGDTLKLCIPYTHTAVLEGIRPKSMDGKDPNGLLIIFKRGPAPVQKDDQEKKGEDTLTGAGIR
jgi:uncharacterized protein (TIGR03067 family)